MVTESINSKQTLRPYCEIVKDHNDYKTCDTNTWVASIKGGSIIIYCILQSSRLDLYSYILQIKSFVSGKIDGSFLWL